MDSVPRFEIEPAEYSTTRKRRSTFASCLLGCLMVAGILMILIAIGAFWLSRNWRGFVADFGKQRVNEAIDASDLPAQEKVEIKEQVERVGTEFGEGRISMEQAVQIIENLTKSPLMPMMTVATIDAIYLDRSGLSDEEKADGRVTLQRYVQGTMEGKISQQDLDSVMSHIADRQGKQGWKLRQRVSDADLRAAIKEAELQADAADIPAEVEVTIDPSDEFKKAIDEALAEPGAEVPQN